MAVPRPVIIAVLGVALISGVFVMMRGQSSSSTVTPAPTAQPAPAHPRPATHPAARPAAPVARPAHPAPKPKAPVATKPAPAPVAAGPVQPVVDALAKGRVVVLLFAQPGSAD